jgi:hypothetical protein
VRALVAKKWATFVPSWFSSSSLAWASQCLPKRPRLSQIPARTKSHLVSWEVKPNWLRGWGFNNGKGKNKPDFSILDLVPSDGCLPRVQSDTIKRKMCSLLQKGCSEKLISMSGDNTCSSKGVSDPRRNLGEMDVLCSCVCYRSPDSPRRTKVQTSICVVHFFRPFFSLLPNQFLCFSICNHFWLTSMFP